jgi:hypothetical protein
MLWDKEFALDPRKFSNLQLRITHNKALGGSAPDAGTLAVFAYIFDDPLPAPRAFLMSKEHYSYSLTASAHEYVNLPRDYPYRMLIPMSYETTYALNTQFGAITWKADNGRKVFIDNLTMTELVKVLPHWEKVEENFAGLSSGSAQTYYIASTYEGYVEATARSAADTALFAAQPSGSAIAMTGTASVSFAATAEGYAAFGAVDLCMHDIMDPGTWFDPKPYGSLVLDITAGSGASGTIDVLLQQLRTY